MQFLVIEGNIGAGKSTLSRMIAEDNNAKLVLEQFADNPFLPKFYKDQERYMSRTPTAGNATFIKSGRCNITAPTNSPPFEPPLIASFWLDV